MANETNGQLNFVSLFFFSFVFHFTQSCPPNLNVVSGSLILFEIKEKEGLYSNIWSQKTQKRTKGTSCSKQFRRSKKLVHLLM